MGGQLRRQPVSAWGWHRLADEWAARVVAEAGIRPGELQRAAARRLSEDGPRGPGRLPRHWDLRLGLPVPRRAFTPPPRVDSVVLTVRKRPARRK